MTKVLNVRLCCGPCGRNDSIQRGRRRCVAEVSDESFIGSLKTLTVLVRPFRSSSTMRALPSGLSYDLDQVFVPVSKPRSLGMRTPLAWRRRRTRATPITSDHFPVVFVRTTENCTSDTNRACRARTAQVYVPVKRHAERVRHSEISSCIAMRDTRYARFMERFSGEARRRSGALFGNEKVAELVLALDRSLPTTAQAVALPLGIPHNLVTPVLRRLVGASLIAPLPRVGSRSAAYYDRVYDPAWDQLVRLCRTLSGSAEGDDADETLPSDSHRG